MTPSTRYAVGLVIALSATVSLGGCGGGPDTTPRSPAAGTSTAAPASAGPGTASGPTTGTDVPAPPVRVVVPSIGLDEPLVDLGIGSDGAMEAPADPADAGWFTGGGRPGGRGPTVVAGHVDSTTGPAVFADLTEVSVGEEVVVHAADGTASTYRVTEVADHGKDDFPTPLVFGATVEDTVRLVTCTGDFDSASGSYEQNRVVYGTAVVG